MNLDQPAVIAGVSPSPTRLAVPRGIGIHFDESAPGNPGVSAGSPPAPGAGAGAGSPPAGSGAGSPPAGSVISWETAPAQLRNEYQQTRTKLEPWEKLNAKPEDVQRSHSTYTKLSTEATSLGSTLGYDAAEIQAAFDADPAGTIAFLRHKAKDTRGPEQPLTRAEIEKLADARAREAMKPFQLEREQQLDTAAVTRFDGEFDRVFKTSFPNGLPDSNKEALSGLAWSLLMDNKDGYGALRNKSDATSVTAAFEQAKKTFLKIITDYGEHEKKRIGGGGPEVPNQQPTRKPQSLDDMISNLGNPNLPMEQVFTGR